MSQNDPQNHNSFLVANGYAPEKGPRSLKVAFNFATSNPFTYDLTQAQQLDKLEFVQTVYADNSANPFPLSISTLNTQQLITFPPFSQGYLPILAGTDLKFTINSPGATTGTVRVQFLTMALPALITYPQITGALGTDFSANKPSTAASLLATAAVNGSRQCITVQNQSANQIQVVRDDGVGGNVSYILLGAGSGANTQGNTWVSTTFKGRVRVYSSSGSDQIAMFVD